MLSLLQCKFSFPFRRYKVRKCFLKHASGPKTHCADANISSEYDFDNDTQQLQQFEVDLIEIKLLATCTDDFFLSSSGCSRFMADNDNTIGKSAIDLFTFFH